MDELMMTTFLNFSSANQFVMNLNTFTKCGCKLHYPLQNINIRKACLNYGKKQMRLDNLPSNVHWSIIVGRRKKAERDFPPARECIYALI